MTITLLCAMPGLLSISTSMQRRSGRELLALLFVEHCRHDNAASHGALNCVEDGGVRETVGLHQKFRSGGLDLAHDELSAIFAGG
jgi:hypothetical protein